ncbi:MAG: hypothetical protein A2Y34_08040 [Spirochaetes bacterium GWC1_27_15]|nr:MAG: hypothetical protein A2Y34_08040 [Spirochaetes bacterium GWC1_27_15]
MFFTGEMRYMQLIVLERDFEKTIDLLGNFGWVEIKRSDFEKKEKFTKLNELIDATDKKIIEIANFFDIQQDNENGNLVDLQELITYFSSVESSIKPYFEKLTQLKKIKYDLENQLKEIEQFKNLKITKKELENFTFLHFFIGSILPEDIEKLKITLKDKIVEIKLEDGFYIIFTSKKGRWSVESELKKLSFKEKKLNTNEELIPADVFIKIKEELNKTEEEIKKIDDFKAEFLKKDGKNIPNYIESFNLQKVYFGVYQNIKHSESISLIEGWILKKKVDTLKDSLNKMLSDKFSVVTYKPEEIPEVQNGTLKVPVIMENLKFFKPFENLVFNYGTPSYKTIDPTIFVTITFLLFFGMMYGDIGQGFIIFLAGIFLSKTKKFKDMGFIISVIGVFAMIFGLFYGAFFCFEHEELKSILLPINKFLFGVDKPYLIDLSPENSMNIFLLTIGFGFVINLFGMLINIVNNILQKKIINVLFSPTGITGFIMLASIVSVAVQYVVLKVNPPSFWLFIILGCLILIFVREPLTNLLKKHKPLFHETITYWAFLSFVEVFEVILNTISNNLSFIRIGAFAFAHSILSSTTIMLVDMVGGAGTFGGILVLIIGNAIIIGLEGMIVGIQTIRLEYYEFFSKFFSEQGRKFIPFKIEKNRMEAL